MPDGELSPNELVKSSRTSYDALEKLVYHLAPEYFDAGALDVFLHHLVGPARIPGDEENDRYAKQSLIGLSAIIFFSVDSDFSQHLTLRHFSGVIRWMLYFEGSLPLRTTFPSVIASGIQLFHDYFDEVADMVDTIELCTRIWLRLSPTDNTCAATLARILGSVGRPERLNRVLYAVPGDDALNATAIAKHAVASLKEAVDNHSDIVKILIHTEVLVALSVCCGHPITRAVLEAGAVRLATTSLLHSIARCAEKWDEPTSRSVCMFLHLIGVLWLSPDGAVVRIKQSLHDGLFEGFVRWIPLIRDSDDAQGINQLLALLRLHLVYRSVLKVVNRLITEVDAEAFNHAMIADEWGKFKSAMWVPSMYEEGYVEPTTRVECDNDQVRYIRHGGIYLSITYLTAITLNSA